MQWWVRGGIASPHISFFRPHRRLRRRCGRKRIFWRDLVPPNLPMQILLALHKHRDGPTDRLHSIVSGDIGFANSVPRVRPRYAPKRLRLTNLPAPCWPFHCPSCTSTRPRDSTTLGTPVTSMPSYRL